jgi:hypothetical protein
VPWGSFPISYRPSKDFAGEMAEWLKAHAWKACLLERVTWVRIPLSPPVLNDLTTTKTSQNLFKPEAP